MTNRRDLNLSRYNISKPRYRELLAFCQQYREKKQKIAGLTEIGAAPTERCGSNGITTDRTGELAIQRATLQADIDLIESSAKEADPDLFQYIISNVADGIPFHHLDIPASESTFRRARRKFFNILDQKKS